MPNNGQLLEAWKNPSDYGWDAMALRCQSTYAAATAGSGTVTYGHSATAETNWTPDINTAPAGMLLTVESQFDGTSGTWAVAYYGPGAPFGGYHASGATYLSTVSIEVRPTGVLIYSKLTGSLFRILWTGLEVYVNDVLTTTLSGFDGISNGVGPNYVPILGIPVVLTGTPGASHSAAPALPLCDSGSGGGGGSGGGSSPATSLPASIASYDPCDPGAGLPIHYESTGNQVVSGGWRFYVDGAWEDLPVTPYVENPPAIGDCANVDLTGFVTSTGTWGNHLALTASRYYKLEYIGREYPSRSYVDVVCEDGTTRVYGTGDVECSDDGCGETRLYRDIYKETNRTITQGASVRLQPDLNHDLIRLGDDHAAEMFRGTFPQVTGRASKACTSRVGTADCVVSSSAQSFETHPELSSFVGVVGNGSHPTLECLTKQFLAPCSADSSRNESISYEYLGVERACVCPWDWFEVPTDPCGPGGSVSLVCGVEWPSDYETTWVQETSTWRFPYHVSNKGDYQWHEVPEARYLGTWCNPFWLLGYWTKPGEDGGGWEVDGEPLPWPIYWGLIREQHFADDFLPEGERTFQRNHLILSPAESEQGHTPFLDYAFGTMRWAGVSRWKTMEVIIPSSLTLSLARPGVWEAREQDSVPDCTVTLTSGGIVLSSFATEEGAEAWVELDLAQWAEDPWLLLQLITRLRVGWDLANVDSVTVSLVGWDNAATELGTIQGEYDLAELRNLQQAKFAGSWAIDNGVLVVPDTGADIGADGISATIMSTPETVLAFQLANGRTWAKLRFAVVPTFAGGPPAVPTGSVTIDWPEFDFVSGEPRLVWENGKICVILWENGPGIRWGQNTWFFPIGGFQDPPVPTGLGVTGTMVDALATAKRLLTGTGGASLETDIVGDLPDYVDSYEGPASLAVVDKFGLAVPLPYQNITDAEAGPSAENSRVRFAMINSFAEVPPMSCWPTRKRLAPTWIPTSEDEYWAGVYDWTQRTRYIVSGGQQLKLSSAPGVDVGSPVSDLPAPWFGWEFAPALDNTEDGWLIVAGELALAEVRPFHGFYALPPGETDRSPAVLETWEPRFVKATVKQDGNILVRHALFSSPPYILQTTATETGDCDEPCLYEEPRHSAGLVLLYTRDPEGAAPYLGEYMGEYLGELFGSSGPSDPAGVYYRRSHDLGATWEDETMAFEGGKQPKARAGDQSVVLAAFKYDSGTAGPGTIVARYWGDGDDEPGAEFTWKDHVGTNISVDDGGYDFCQAPDDQERWVASLTVSGESSTSDWISADGCRTWKRVT